MAKLLVDYVDALLRKGGLPEPPEESQVEGRLDELITLYVHLKDKDVFNQYYKRAVSGRMLGEKSISDYLEQAFVSKVKLKCGASHVRDVSTQPTPPGRSWASRRVATCASRAAGTRTAWRRSSRSRATTLIFRAITL